MRSSKDTVSKLLFSMLGDYAMVLDGDKVLSSSSSGPSLGQWCQGKRMVVGTEIGDKKSLNFSFLKRLVEREGLPVSAKGSHEALQTGRVTPPSASLRTTWCHFGRTTP